MSIKVPDNFQQPEFGSDVMDILPGFSAKFTARQLELGNKLELLDENGKLIVEIQRNISGNSGEKSYTLQLADGMKMLLPVPFDCNTRKYNIKINKDESVEIIAAANISKGLHYRLLMDAGEEEVSSVRPQNVDHRELTCEWQGIELGDDRRLSFVRAGGSVLAQLYKVPGIDEYILRDANGVAHERFVDGDSREMKGSSGKRICFKVEKGKFFVKGEQKIVLQTDQFLAGQKIAATRDGFLTGTINGGRQIAMASCREVGLVKKSLPYRNEDNAGYNANTVVIADGLGGHLNGGLASDFAVESVLNSKGSFFEAINNAHKGMKDYTRYFREAAELYNDWFQNGSLKQQPPPRILVPDTVMVAVRFKGDRMDTLAIGDCKIYVVRPVGKNAGKIVYRSREHSFVEEQVAQGIMTRREALLSLERSKVITTLGDFYVPDFDKVELEDGDIVVLMSDGAIMPEHVMINAVVNKSAEEGVEQLLAEKEKENKSGGGIYYLDDGGELPVQLPSFDNVSCAVIVCDKLH
jgi:serine/threonine protein phosphatase PrpC